MDRLLVAVSRNRAAWFSRWFERFETKSCVRKMSENSVLVQKFNPSTGKLEWELQDQNYDYLQELARAGFADMLHDEERNLKYNLALRKAILSLTSKGKSARVLDIGTGTGLLAIMASQSGATDVVACETFQPMVSCAEDVIAHNGCAGKIKLIPKRSTEISVGSDGDMTERANILVTEVFDTELIGEGAIGTFNHAHKHLLSEDSIVVPARADIFIQLVESPIVYSWNRLKPIKCGDHVIHPPAQVLLCSGNGAVHDIQLDQLESSQFKALSDPVSIFQFDWNSKQPIPNEENKSVVLTSTASGTANAIFMWWNLDMDIDGEIVLSCAPSWAHPDGKKLPWRDHWMQALYYLPVDVSIEAKGMKLELNGYHDEYSLWFALNSNDSSTAVSNKVPRPFCTCSTHMAVSRTRLGQINDEQRIATYVQALEKVVNAETVCLTVGDFCSLGLLVSKLGALKVYAAERDVHCRRVLKSWVEENNLQDRIFVIDGDFEKHPISDKINLLLAEPVFASSVLPWHNMYFANWKRDYEYLLSNDAVVMPGKAHIYAIAVEMKDLWKIRSSVGSTQGVDLLPFDKLIMSAVDSADFEIEPHPLWEYPCRALSLPTKMMTVDLVSLPKGNNIHGQINLPVAGKLNGVALWVDWQLDEHSVVSGGPICPPELSKKIQWDMHSKQAVYFLREVVSLAPANQDVLYYQADFDATTFEFKFNFSNELKNGI